MAGALALAGYPALAGPRIDALLILGGMAIVLLGAGLVLGNAMVVTSGVALLACEFVAALYVRDTTATFTAAAYGSALLLVSELAYFSLELGVHHRGGADVLRRRSLAMAALVGASLAAGLSAAAISSAPLPGSVALTVAGIGGLLAAIALVAVVLRENGAGSA